MRLSFTSAALILIFISPTSWSDSTKVADYQRWIQEMKETPRGPFSKVLWFCSDGTILPPKAYACAKHGGGKQHGQLNEHARILRSNGYWIANVLAAIDVEKDIAADNFLDRYNQMLIEKFLITADNGWIMRKALFYRGAIQEEDERDNGRKLLIALVAQPEWIGLRYPALRIGANLIPHGKDTASVQKVRQMAASLADADPGFKNMRVKIHGSPDAGDAQLVRAYADKISDPQSKEKYLALAAEIDRVYQAPPLPIILEENAKVFSGGPWLQKLLRDAAAAYQAKDSPDNHYAVTAKLLANLRDALPKIHSAEARLRVLDLSLAVETANFNASTQLRAISQQAIRKQRLSRLHNAFLAAYGTGLINQRSLKELQYSLALLNKDTISLDTYSKELKYLSRSPGWSNQELRFQFYQSMTKLAEIEPLTLLFIQDQLRGSPMLYASQLLDSLTRDANKLAGVTHKLFGKQIGVGFHALNPGLARGKLYAKPDLSQIDKFDAKGIYVLPETISDLPPITGIITAGEGNPLSHVQLLARNLGIPNVTVNEDLLPQLEKHNGETIIMAVSPTGLVELDSDTQQWRDFFGEKKQQDNIVIRPDLNKLDLTVRKFISLDDLRASDSGRIVGPKAAKLGELRHHYPDKVAQGVAIPFGIFREVVLDKPYKNTQQTVFEWMVERYATIRSLADDSAQKKQLAESFRQEIYDIIMRADLGDKYRQELRTALQEAFGDANTGVFIRSDTNVEDLPGFTGAGLNLTLFNVVGYDNIIKGINAVWASPFTERAFAWRQSLMEHPEHVYPAVLLLQSVANEKSGVLVTEDLDTGDTNILSVAVNEGVGGAVDGQSAESLRINMLDGSVRMLAPATAPLRNVPSPDGGIQKLPVSGSETVLKPDEIKQLIQFAKELPNTFPSIVDDQGNPAAADVEFGFLHGRLQLFQLRPFLQSSKAQGNNYLQNMDKALQGKMNQQVDMNGVPQS
jgi:Pyruvate phosphate dikinase, AMP/ATP-binding domain